MNEQNTDPQEIDITDDLRPYTDSEIPAAMKRMADSPVLGEIVAYALPGASLDEIRNTLVKIKTADEFQMVFVKAVLENIVKATSSGFTIGGTELLHKDTGHLLMSNHRDIVLDGALLQLMLLKAGLPTSEITFGSNLISSAFVEDFGRSNKMYKIMRGGSARDLLRNSILLSQHLHDVVDDGRSIWISQRDGRTKDGNDKTDQGLIKMLTMHGESKDVLASLASLHIAPVAISYEYESCDALKARELYISRRETYVKAPGEDMRSILTGIRQYKGEIHMEVCNPISRDEVYALDGQNNNEILRGMASIIDKRIYTGYKLFATNYIAYDLREGVNTFKDKYTVTDKDKFIDYLHTQAKDVEYEGNNEFMEIMLDIYANPVKNKLSLT